MEGKGREGKGLRKKQNRRKNREQEKGRKKAEEGAREGGRQAAPKMDINVISTKMP